MVVILLLLVVLMDGGVVLSVNLHSLSIKPRASSWQVAREPRNMIADIHHYLLLVVSYVT